MEAMWVSAISAPHMLEKIKNMEQKINDFKIKTFLDPRLSAMGSTSFIRVQ
jgi:hypothetical protein